MNRSRLFLPVLLTLVALLVVAPAAGAKTPGKGLPDLVVKNVSKPPATKTIGSKLRMVVKVRNVGQTKAGKSKLGLYLGKGKKHTKKDKRLKRVKVKPLAAGKTKKLKLRVTLPAKTKAGTYRLFACADDTKKVKESKERNCRATRKVQLVPVAPPSPPPALAFTMADGVDWGFVENAQRESLDAGDPVTLTLTAGNGIPGQAGYSRAGVPSEPFRAGLTTTLDFKGTSNNEDDGQVTRPLPFAFPFGGVNEQSISISTNGWVSFGSPAWDYWDDSQPTDYRGIQAVVGELERGLMPYWADLDLREQGAGTGTVKEVVAPDGSWVAYQWDIGQHAGGVPRRTFQIVLFPDGSFRFDYPGVNAPGGNKSFVGYSLGTGPASADIVSAEGTTVPASGLLFTPNALPAVGPSAPGQTTAVLPKGSSLVSATAGCVLATAPGPFNTGLVSCPVPALGLGQQASQAVTFAMPGDAPGETRSANFRLLGTYLSSGLALTDRDEIDDLTTNLRSTTISIGASFASSPYEVGTPETIEVTISSASGGLDEPTVKFELAKATFSAIEIDGKLIECTPPSGGSTTCMLPSGTDKAVVDVIVIPSAGTLELKTTAQALNAPPAVLNVSYFS
jgi:CARDB protein